MWRWLKTLFFRVKYCWWVFVLAFHGLHPIGGGKRLFRSKKGQETTPQFQTVYDPFSGVRGKLSSYLEGQVGKPGPSYPGEFVAPASEAEEESLGFLEGIPKKPFTGESFRLAKEEVQKTLSGDYDPSKSPFYQAVKAEAGRNLEKTQEGIAQNRALGRRFFSGSTVAEQGRAATDVNIALDRLLGELSETERGRRLQAVPVAAGLERYEEAAPFERARQFQSLGALPRELKQASLDAAYREWLRSQVEYPFNIAQLSSGLAAREPHMIPRTFGPKQRAPIRDLIEAGLSSF